MIFCIIYFWKENSSDDEGKCLMDQIVESHNDTSNENDGILDIDPSQVAIDSKTEWNATSVYQVKNLVKYSPVENIKKITWLLTYVLIY